MKRLTFDILSSREKKVTIAHVTEVDPNEAARFGSGVGRGEVG